MAMRVRSSPCCTRPIWARSRTNQRSPFSAASRLRSYDDTLKNLILTPETKVLVQGFTGKQSTFDSQLSIEYGTKIVGGVRPGKTGEHLGLPYYPSVKEANEKLKPDATLVYVAAGHAAGAIEDAIEAEIPLVVAVAEHIPLHDMLRVQAMLRSQSKTRFLGANSPGMTSTHARCRLGFQPLNVFKTGKVGLVAKSGTMSYEAVAATTRAGLGQSYCIGIGGDDLPGTDFVDALRILEQDQNTEGIVLIGEIGGHAEEEAASWIQDYHARTKNPKPIVGVIGGLNPVQGRVMGHDGAFQSRGEQPASAKARRLAKAGVVIADHPSYVGEEMKKLLGASTIAKQGISPNQRRSIHTQIRQRPQGYTRESRTLPHGGQRRTLYFQAEQSLDILEKFDIPTIRNVLHPQRTFDLSFQVHRAYYKPAIHIRRRPRTMPDSAPVEIVEAQMVYPIEGDHTVFKQDLEAILSRFVWQSDAERSRLTDIITRLTALYHDKEAKHFWITVGTEMGASLDQESSFGIVDAELEFDTWAYTMGKRHEELHSQQYVTEEMQVETEVAKDNIVYLKRPNPAAKIGTIVNGAGLAMNTVDILDASGLPATNFLDTGGKATADTVSKSFRAVLGDARVAALFVNIFGGLTKAEVIADGILLAYQDVGVEVPVVVRLRGTNEELGRRRLEEGAREMGVASIKEEKAKGKRGGLTAVESFDEALRVLRRAIDES